MTSNYEDVLAQLQAAGLQVTALEVGRLVRCRVEGDREKRGWYSLHEVQTRTGELILIGSYGVWRGAENNAQKIEFKGKDFTAEERATFRKRLADEKRRADAVRAAEARRAAAKAEAAWRKCAPTGSSDYLDRKGVQAHGLRFSPSGACAVPITDTLGRIHGLQIIRGVGKRTGRLEKEYFPTGMAMRGHFHLLGSPAGLVLVAEGYATAATLFEAGGGSWAVAVAFDAGNLTPVAEALAKRYRFAKILICADDDIFGTCIACKAKLSLAENPETCPACGGPHKRSNAGVLAAQSAALAVNGAWIAPKFTDTAARRAAFFDKNQKLSDFNDLYLAESQSIVRQQVQAAIEAHGWNKPRSAATPNQAGAGETELKPIDKIDDLLDRYALVYGQGGMAFDYLEHSLISLTDVQHVCSGRYVYKAWSEHPDRKVVRMAEVGFDPAEKDTSITCNLWGGWPTTPKQGTCEMLLKLLRHMCSAEHNKEELFEWVLKWIAYPIQHPGAKMQTTLVLHGPQGTGKNMFFEALMSIYGTYGRIIDQSAVEDRFNEWASKKLFLIADEVVARSEVWHVKNKLKAFITGDWIRINPKNIAAYDERNHVNIVFLSNEAMPVVIEEDDRRHTVIWTPSKLDADFYKQVKLEIENGGIAALHHHLLNEVDLGDFSESTKPPLTGAKEELAMLSLDTPSRFYYELESGEILPDIKATETRPALSQDVYDVYRLWCARSGSRAAPMNKFINALQRRHHIPTQRLRYIEDDTEKGPHSVLMIGKHREPPPGEDAKRWYGTAIRAFRFALKDYRGIT
jgi:putative DNA primase/helicase